ncbi:hypothetical protein CEXT_742751 [Caerostris extrusa]|uniref:Uncharacterized protein n=1 Tax=Caerostris extrusa TaxID=172846 RepID=A0AAV4U8W0_CAEEX|nr:hypothetical protein CEXT_742751 [Caerostris extrusa]
MDCSFEGNVTIQNAHYLVECRKDVEILILEGMEALKHLAQDVQNEMKSNVFKRAISMFADWTKCLKTEGNWRKSGRELHAMLEIVLYIIKISLNCRERINFKTQMDLMSTLKS